MQIKWSVNCCLGAIRLLLGKQYGCSHKISRMLAMEAWSPDRVSVPGSKNIHKRKTEREKNVCLLWWVDGLFIWEDIALPRSPSGPVSCVFVKQQKLRKRKGAWKEAEAK